jgi:hypothetical protein
VLLRQLDVDLQRELDRLLVQLQRAVDQHTGARLAVLGAEAQRVLEVDRRQRLGLGEELQQRAIVGRHRVQREQVVVDGAILHAQAIDDVLEVAHRLILHLAGRIVARVVAHQRRNEAARLEARLADPHVDGVVRHVVHQRRRVLVVQLEVVLLTEHVERLAVLGALQVVLDDARIVADERRVREQLVLAAMRANQRQRGVPIELALPLALKCAQLVVAQRDALLERAALRLARLVGADGGGGCGGGVVGVKVAQRVARLVEPLEVNLDEPRA